MSGAAPRKKANAFAAILPILIGTISGIRLLLDAKIVSTGSRLVFPATQLACEARPALSRRPRPICRLCFNDNIARILVKIYREEKTSHNGEKRFSSVL